MTDVENNRETKKRRRKKINCFHCLLSIQRAIV